MSERIECPYCANIIHSDQLPYNQTVQLKCPNCSGSFDYVPGFGTLTSKEKQTSEGMMEPERPSPAPTPPPKYRDPIFAEGRARPDPRFPKKKPSKPFEPGKECTRAFCITAALCGVCWIIMIVMMGFAMSTIPFYP